MTPSGADQSHGGLIEAIYDVALDPSGWSDLLTRLVQAVSGTVGVVQGVGPGLDVFFTDRNSDPAEWMRRSAEYGRGDPFSPYMVRSLEGDLTRVATAMAVTPVHAYQRSRFWNEHLGSLGLGDTAAMVLLEPSKGQAAVVSLALDRAKGAFTESQIAALQRLAPHLRLSARLGRRIMAEGPPATSYLAVLDALPIACVLLDADARPLHLTPAATRVLEDGSGVALSHGRLGATDADADGALQRALSAACGQQGRRRGAEIVIRRPGQPPMLAVITPLGEANPWLHRLGGARAAVYLLEPRRLDPDVAAERRLMKLFGLTPAQASITLALAQGLSPAEIAELRGTSLQTIRAQVRDALGGLRVRRVSELARIHELLTPLAARS